MPMNWSNLQGAFLHSGLGRYAAYGAAAGATGRMALNGLNGDPLFRGVPGAGLLGAGAGLGAAYGLHGFGGGAGPVGTFNHMLGTQVPRMAGGSRVARITLGKAARGARKSAGRQAWMTGRRGPGFTRDPFEHGI